MIRGHLEGWGAALASQVSVLRYDELWDREQFAAGTYVFSDFERLSDRELQRAGEVWDSLERSPVETRMLNNPHRVLGRYDLLRSLSANETNPFSAYRLHEAAAARFPVFVRREHEHSGSLTRLLWSRAELARAVAWLWQRGEPLHDLLVVEFCDTADAHGAYRKYGAYVIGNRIIPRSLAFDVNWVVKPTKAPPPSAAQLRLEAQYIDTNPHREWLMGVFDLAGVDYGRIDYSMDDERPVVWEINTNPWYGFRRKMRPPERGRLWQVAAEQLEAAWRDLDVVPAGDGQRTCRISRPPAFPALQPGRWGKSVRVVSRDFKRRVKPRPPGHSRIIAIVPRIVLRAMWRLDRGKIARWTSPGKDDGLPHASSRSRLVRRVAHRTQQRASGSSSTPPPTTTGRGACPKTRTRGRNKRGGLQGQYSMLECLTRLRTGR